jgi:zinc transporter ZupT
MRRRARVVVPFSAGVLLGLALFGLVPELAESMGWMPAVLLWFVGYGALLLVNRYVYRVCPTCSHDHDHNSCSSELHGFAVPLIAAATLHSMMDGWSVATAQVAREALRVAVPLAISLHKVPEGLALGGILRASMPDRRKALLLCVLAEGATLIGGMAGLWVAPTMGSQWMTYPLGFTAGWLTYLGYHAVHEEWKREGALATALSTGAGLLVAGLLQHQFFHY